MSCRVAERYLGRRPPKLCRGCECRSIKGAASLLAGKSFAKCKIPFSVLLMKTLAYAVLILLGCSPAFAQTPSNTSAKKRLLFVGEEKGYRHESVSQAMACIERLGAETGL